MALNASIAPARDDIARRITLHDDWHHALLAGCGNRELPRLIDAMKRRMRVYGHHYWQDSASRCPSGSPVAGLEDNFRGTMERLARRLAGS